MAYKYLRRPPSRTRMEIHELPEHRFGYVRRTDIERPRYEEFRPECLCGAKSEEWFGTKQIAERRWFEKHIEAVEKQETLAL